MNSNILKTFALSAILIGAVSCKDRSAEAATSEAKDVPEAPATAVDYNVDVEASSITWKGSKPLGTHNGTIDLASGTFSVMGDDIEAGKFSIDMNSITDLDLEGEMKTTLENHLKGTTEGKEGDFFNVNEYPFSMFRLTEIKEKDGKTMVSGNLTMKDKTNNIEFPATVSISDGKLELKSESFIIDRTLWGVNYGSKTVFDNLGDKFIDDDMEITVSVVANRS